MLKPIARFRIPIYRAAIVLYVAREQDEFEELVDALGFREDCYEAHAFVYSVSNLSYTMVFNVTTPGNIAHECLHIVDHIFEDIGAGGTPPASETRHYLLGYLVDTISKKLKGYD